MTGSCPRERFPSVAEARLELNLRRIAATGTDQAERVAAACDGCQGAHITRVTHRRAAA